MTDKTSPEQLSVLFRESELARTARLGLPDHVFSLWAEPGGILDAGSPGLVTDLDQKVVVGSGWVPYNAFVKDTLT